MPAHDDTIANWNERSGVRWAARADKMDRRLAEIGDRLLDRSGAGAGQAVLDVGCGAGRLSLQLERRVAPGGHVAGVDISRPLLDVARRRADDAEARRVTFLEGDAETHPFDRGTFDRIVSRFGVMFFGDTAAALANLATGLRPGGTMTFAVWADLDHNPWARVPREVAARHADVTADPSDDEPGPFRLADPRRLESRFRQAGLPRPTIDAAEGLFSLGDDIDAAVDFCLDIGPLAGPAREAPERREAMEQDLRRALAPFASAGGVHARYRAWLVSVGGA